MKNFFLLLVAVLLIKNASAQCGTIVTQTNVTCNANCDGSITFTPSSGTPPYSLSINAVPVTSFATSYTITGLCAGTFNWLITDAIVSCSDNGIVVISEPTVLIAYDSVFTSATCNGLNNGVACATTNFGGTPPYFFLWANGDTTQCTSGLFAGFYSVTVTDANGCTADTGAFVFEPTPLVVSIGTTSNVSCNGGNDGAVTVNANGGTAPYNYVWSPFGGINATAAGLTAGTYTVLVTDANGCTALQSVPITEPPPVITSVIPNQIICPGDSVQLYVNGGITYQWSPVTGLSNANISNPWVLITSTAVYTVIVTDINGCTGIATVVVSIDDVTINIGSIFPSCGQCDGYATPAILVVDYHTRTIGIHWGKQHQTSIACARECTLYL